MVCAREEGMEIRIDFYMVLREGNEYDVNFDSGLVRYDENPALMEECGGVFVRAAKSLA